MQEVKHNIDLKLKLFYKDCLINTEVVKRNKPFIIGRHKKVLWQILDSKFPSKYKFVESIAINSYKINLPPKAKIEKLEKNNIAISKEEKEKLTKVGSFLIDNSFSGTIILNSDYMVRFFFTKKLDVNNHIPSEYKNILKRPMSSEDRRVIIILSFLIVFWLVISILAESLTLPERIVEEIKFTEYAQIFMPSMMEEDILITKEAEFAEGKEPGEGIEDEEVSEPVLGREEQIAQASEEFRTQLFASIGGIGTTGSVASGFIQVGGMGKIEEEEPIDIALALESGKAIPKTNIPIGIRTRVSIAGEGLGQIEGEKFVDVTEAEKLERTGQLEKAKNLSIKGSIKARKARKKADLLNVIASYSGGLEFIHSEMLKKYPDLFGKIYLKFVISEQGYIKSLNIIRHKSTINNPEFENRILEKVHSWRFPTIAKGVGEIEILYPLIFIRKANG